MMDNYKVLGLTKDASEEEVDLAYEKLKKQYSEERFLEGEKGNEAAKNLTKIETAYAEIIADRKNVEQEKQDEMQDFTEIESLIRAGRISEAQSKLDDFTNRTAEWHYLQAVIFYKKNWYNESKKQLEIALNMDPYNNKYADTLAKLRQKTDFNERRFNNQGANMNANDQRQMGGSGANDCMQFCVTWCCVNALCNSCCN